MYLIVLLLSLLLSSEQAYSACTTKNSSFDSSGISVVYKCDTEAEFPTSGINIGDEAVALNTGKRSYATATNTWGISNGSQATVETLVNKTFTAPVLGAATGTSLAVTGAVTSSGGGIGYATGAGGTVTQSTSRVTAVTLSKLSGTITMFSAAVAAAASSTFVLTNTFIAATDIVICQHPSTTNASSWQIETIPASGSCTIVVKNISAASITEATPIKFVVIKGVTS